MKFETIILKEINVIGKRISCPFEEFQHEIPKARQELQDRIKEINNIKNSGLQLGVHKENGSNEFEDAYFIGYEVEFIESVPHEMVSLTIPAQTYGKVTYKGPEQGLHDGYSELCKWLDHEGHENLKSSWTVEFIPTSKNWKEEMDNFELDICIPINMK